MKIALNFMSNIGDKITKNLTSAVTHGAEKLAWTIRILLECLQHILKMYAWSLSENQASVQFKCRLIALMLKQSLFRKHDFAIWVYQIYHDYQNQCFWQLKNYLNISSVHTKEEYSDKSTGFHYYGGGKALIFSSDELHLYVSADLHEQQQQQQQQQPPPPPPPPGSLLCRSGMSTCCVVISGPQYHYYLLSQPEVQRTDMATHVVGAK